MFMTAPENGGGTDGVAGSGADHGVTPEVSELSDLVERCAARLGDADVGSVRLLDGPDAAELSVAVEALWRRVFHLRVQAVGQLDATGYAGAVGATSLSALLTQLLKIRPGEAGDLVRVAAMTCPRVALTGELLEPELPALADALTAAAIGPAQAATVAATMRRLPLDTPAELRELCEEQLVDNGIQTPAAEFGKFAQKIDAIADPDGTLDPRPPADKAELHLGRRDERTGTTRLWGRLDDHGVQLLRAATDDLSAPRGDAAAGIVDTRSPATRFANALTECLDRALRRGDGPENHGVTAHVTVTLHYDALLQLAERATLGTGAAISGPMLRMLLCDADYLPVVLGGSSEILDAGRRLRHFTPAMRAAIVARDRGCTFPACTRPAGWCHTHHVNWWARDHGDTSVGNGALLCAYHHQLIHHSDWTMRMGSDGRPEFLPPAWMDPDRRPMRNTAHHLEPRLTHPGTPLPGSRPPEGRPPDDDP
jgi:hypothetical protein